MAKPSSVHQPPLRVQVFHAVWICWVATLGLLLLGLWLIYAVVLQPFDTYPWEAFRNVVGILWVCALLMGVFLSVDLTWRAVRLIRCRWEPGYRVRLEQALLSPRVETVRRALQTLLDYRGQPFGEVDLGACDELQLRMVIALYRAWWGRFDDTTPDSIMSARKAGDIVQRLSVAYVEMVRESGIAVEEPSQRDPELERLPTLEVARVCEVLQPAYLGTLDVLIDSINRSTNRDDVRTCRQQALELYASLAEQTVERAWRLRFDAVERQQPGR